MGTQRKTITKAFMYTCIYDHGKHVGVSPLLSQELPQSWLVVVVPQYRAELFSVGFLSSFNTVQESKAHRGQVSG